MKDNDKDTGYYTLVTPSGTAWGIQGYWSEGDGIFYFAATTFDDASFPGYGPETSDVVSGIGGTVEAIVRWEMSLAKS